MWIYGLTVFMEIHHLAMFGGHWSSASGDIKYLRCHVSLQKYLIEGSSKCISGNPSWYVTALPSLAAIVTVVVEICF